jgi:AAA+ ATPase superfamily predicted ATPase
MLPVGGPAVGKGFFDREKEVGDILRLVERDNIALISPRRYGKTSVMREVERSLNERGYLCLFLDIMYVDAPEEFVIELATAAFDVASARRTFVRGLKDSFIRFSELFEEIEASVAGTGLKVKFRGGLKKEINENNWTERGKDIFDAIKSMTNKKPIYVVIDELSECINNMIKSEKDARKFLQWFRSIRQQTIEDVRFIVGGSVSFDRVVRGINGLSLINDFERVPVEGFSKEDALKFIEKGFIDEELEYRKEIGEKLLDCIGEPYVPYFTAILFQMTLREAGGDLTENGIDEVYNSKLLGAQGKGYFDHYKDRLRIYYDGLMAKAAKEILREACLADEGVPKQFAFQLFIDATNLDDEERFMDLLYDLENDFYITFDAAIIRFQSKVLRDWWRLYHV